MTHTIFLDIDGTILIHKKNLYNMITEKPELIDGTIEKLNEWHTAGHNIVLTTARPEGARYITEKQLADLGIIHHRLIMNIGSGPRVVINDTKPNGEITAKAFPIIRNSGIKNIII